MTFDKQVGAYTCQVRAPAAPATFSLHIGKKVIVIEPVQEHKPKTHSVPVKETAADEAPPKQQKNPAASHAGSGQHHATAPAA